MYPLKLGAPIKDYLWGGTRLKTEYGFETDKEKAAEAWVLSCHKDGESTVLNGEMKGKELSEVLKLWGNEAIGKRAEKFPYFP
ncbi:MAG: mannose-6-phosphate isomerase, partial [Oscillospiraceae bacterium]|nr:mannose-6-phosphate isomerase [Oscillospiraceae bacterium]